DLRERRAVLRRGIVVAERRQARLACSVDERMHERVRDPRPDDALRPVAAAVFALAVLEPLAAPEVRQQAREIPAHTTLCGPSVVVACVAAAPHHRADRAAAAEAPAAAVPIDEAASRRVRLDGVQPVELATDLLDERGDPNAQRARLVAGLE